MADIKDLTPALQRLDAHIDGLEEVLEPLLSDLQEISSQLPLLDKAKLFSLTAYAIESLLFSALKLQGADAQNHAVFTELRRVQQYFAKIKAAEEPQEPQASRNLTVNQEAAARMLKSDLGDNKSISSKLAEKIAEERAKALLKSMESNKKRPAEGSAQPSEGDEPKKTLSSSRVKKQKGKKKGGRG